MKYAAALFGIMATGFTYTPASAVSITLGGNSVAGEGQVSVLTGKNVFTETFNACAKGSVNGIGNFNVVSGSQSGRYAAPTGDRSCYATIPEKNGSGTLNLAFDTLRNSSKDTREEDKNSKGDSRGNKDKDKHEDDDKKENEKDNKNKNDKSRNNDEKNNNINKLADATLDGTEKYDYLGFYWGSVDQYNSVKFYDLNNVLVTTITGGQILALTHGEAGNQISDKSNVYVNLWFSPTEYIHRAEFISTGWAFELDNVSVRHAQLSSKIPEPGSLPLLATALLACPLLYRKRQRVRP